MSTLATPPPSSDAGPEGGSRLDPFDALCRLIRRGQGRFVFALVEYNLPRERDAVLDRLRAIFSDLNLVTVALTPPPPDAPPTLNVLDQLGDLVRTASPDRKPDALLITGYETLFPDAPDDAQLARAIQPLNLGRNLLAEMFPCPVVLFLPSPAMAVFLRSAPDLGSWRSGFFPFHADLDGVRAELAQAARAGAGWRERRRLAHRTPEALHAEAQHLEALLADAGALPAESSVSARLYERLGWVSVALGSRTQARWAFAEMLRLAREHDDRHLLRSAERGQRAAERVATTHAGASPERAAAARQVFRGAAALTGAEGLYGREEELRTLLARVAADTVVSRFQTVWGETGCGKSSLVQAGLVPELEKLGRYLPVIIRQWNTPEASVQQALERALGLVLDACASLRDAVAHVAGQTGKTVVIVCDQFEQFFAARAQRSECEPFLKAVGECVNDFRLPCKFLFVVREDELGRMAGFDSYVAEPLELAKRFYLPLFSAEDAIRVLRQQSDEAGLGWPDPFIRTVVGDLTRDGRVRPIELQLVAAALAASGINDDLNYARAGRAQGLLADYLDLVIKDLTDQSTWASVMEFAARAGVLPTLWLRVALFLLSVLPNLSPAFVFVERFVWRWVRRRLMRDTKRVLLALVAEPEGRLALSSEEIARRTGLVPVLVHFTLDGLADRHLVRPVDDGERYELTHDILADLTLAVTRDLQDNRRQANRVLRRALEDCAVNPRHTIGLRDWRLVRSNADEDERARPRARSLLRRSLLWGGFKWFVLPPVGIVLVLAFVQCTYGYVSLERDFAERVVVRRGLPWLGFLPVLGDGKGYFWVIGDGVVLDTGITVADLKREQQARMQGLIQWEWGNQRSKALEQLAGALKSVEQGSLWCEIGQRERGIPVLMQAVKDSKWAEARVALGKVALADPKLVLAPVLNAVNDSDPLIRLAAVYSLQQVALADSKLAGKVLAPLLSAFYDRDQSTRRAAVFGLGQVALADPKLADIVLDLLFNDLKDRGNSTHSEAVLMLGMVATAEPMIASKVLGPLLHALKDEDSGYAAAGGLGQVALADTRLASKVLYPLLNALSALKESNTSKGTAAAESLGLVARADPRLSGKVLDSLLNALKDSSFFVRPEIIRSLGYLARADSNMAGKVLDPLLNALTDEYSLARSAAVEALGQVVRADPNLTGKLLNPLLKTLQDSDSSVRSAAVGALGQIARTEPMYQARVFKFLTDYDVDVRRGARDSLADLLVDEAKKKSDPVRFLLDHLEGRLSLMPTSPNLPKSGNANTFAVYRDMVVGAMARVLASNDPKAKAEQARLREELQRLRGDGRLHLRIAAWKVFVEAAELRDWLERGVELELDED